MSTSIAREYSHSLCTIRSIKNLNTFMRSRCAISYSDRSYPLKKIWRHPVRLVRSLRAEENVHLKLANVLVASLTVMNEAE
jgi:hypothetical protein